MVARPKYPPNVRNVLVRNADITPFDTFFCPLDDKAHVSINIGDELFLRLFLARDRRSLPLAPFYHLTPTFDPLTL